MIILRGRVERGISDNPLFYLYFFSLSLFPIRLQVFQGEGTTLQKKREIEPEKENNVFGNHV